MAACRAAGGLGELSGCAAMRLARVGRFMRGEGCPFAWPCRPALFWGEQG